MGTIGELGLSFLGVDVVQDVRDLSYDVLYWNKEWQEIGWDHAAITGVDALSVLPVIGMIGKADEVWALCKRADNLFVLKRLTDFEIADKIAQAGTLDAKYLSSTAGTALKQRDADTYREILETCETVAEYKQLYGGSYNNEVVEDIVKRINNGELDGGIDAELVEEVLQKYGKNVYQTTQELVKLSACTQDELYKYLFRNVDENTAKAFLDNGKWPDGVQIPKNSSVLNPDGSINWSKAPKGGYTLDANGEAIKESFTPQIGEVIDRYGAADGRYTSPVINGKTFEYTQRSLPYIEDMSNYHKYEVIGDFNKFEEYVSSCVDTGLKAQIEDAVIKYYDGDYRNLMSYKGEAAAVDGWGIGGAIQYEFSLTIEQLVGLGILKEIK